MTKCKVSKLDPEKGYWCNMYDQPCLIHIPDSKLCAEWHGKGPDAKQNEEGENIC